MEQGDLIYVGMQCCSIGQVRYLQSAFVAVHGCCLNPEAIAC